MNIYYNNNGDYMKKILFILLFIPYLVIAKENIYIESIELQENNNVEIVKPASANELNVDLDLRFNKVDSYIVYKMVIKNTSKEDYEIDNINLELDSSHMEYTFNCDGNNKIINSRKTKTCYLKVTYKNRVTFETLKTSNGKIIEEKNVRMDLSNVEITNPKTGYLNISLLLLIFIGFCIALYVYANDKDKKKSFLILFLALIIPISINAVEKISINVNVKIEINGNSRECSHTPRNLKEYIMCELETDLYDFYKEKIEKELSDNTDLSESRRKELNDDLESFDNLVESLDWDNSYIELPNENNYKSLPEGFYTKYALAFIFKDKVDKDYARGHSFTIPNEDVRLRNIQPTDGEIIIGEPTGNYSMDVKMPITYNSTDTKEKIDINFDIHTTLTIETDTDTETSEKHYIWGELTNNPECISITLFNRKFGLINDLIDLYVNIERQSFNINGNDLNTFDSYFEAGNLLEQYFSRGISEGYIQLNKEDMLTNKFYENEKVKDLLKFTYNYDLKKNNYWSNKLSALGDPSKMSTQELQVYNEAYNALENEFNNYYHLSKKENYGLKNYGNKIIFNGKLYQGENAIYEYIVDRNHIDTSGYDNIDEAVADYLFDNFREN